MTVGKWVKFELAAEQKPKTSVWNVLVRKDDLLVGQVKWYGAWRKYAFFPEPCTLFECDCLKDITAFIEQAMKERRKR